MKKAGYLLVAVLQFVVASTWAGTTGQLGGFVFEESGAPLAGISVSARSPSQIGAEQLAITGEDGSFRFPRLAPGYYTVLVEVVGFVPQRLEQVQVRLDRTTGLQVILRKTEFAAEIDVFETTPVVDPVQTSTGQTFSSDYIRVTSSRFSNLVTQTAGASQDWRRVLGSTPQDKAHILDGMDSTNWYERGANPGGVLFIFDVAQEVTIHTSNYQAEFGQATGAIQNISTKSGGNSFSGTLDARYTDNRFESSGEHYDPDERESRYARIAATLGGPILKDRLWFFGSIGRRETKDTGYNAPTTETGVADSFFAKLTWQAHASWSVVGMNTDTPFGYEDGPSSQFRMPEATASQRSDASITSLSTTWMVTPRVLWEIRLGRQITNLSTTPFDGDLSTIGHYNRDLGTSYGNYGSQSLGKSSQNQGSTELSWFVDALGAHDFKAGLSLGQPRFSDNVCLNGSGEPCATGVEGFFFSDSTNETGDPIPYEMQVYKAEGPLDYGADAFAAFVQDTWRVRPNLNMNLGVRWDRVTWKNETGEIADLTQLQPRIGIAWDLFNDGKNMLRASWGRFMHPGTALMARWTNATVFPTENWYSCSAFGVPDAEECQARTEEREFGYRSDPEGWDPAGWFLPPWRVSAVKPGRAINGIKPGVSEQWLVGFEREVFRRSSVEVSYVNKTSTNDIYSTCSGNYPVPTIDHDCDFWVFANLPDTSYEYQGLLMRFETRALDNLHILASWTISDSKGAMGRNRTGGTTDYDYYPDHYVNRWGHLSDHSLHRAKLNGYWLLPYDFSLAFEGWWQSEFRWTPYDSPIDAPSGVRFVEPRGSGKGGALHQIDLQIAKGFKAGPARLVALARIFNVTSSQSADEICERVNGCGGFDFGDAIGWQQPRSYELGFRVEF